MMLARIAPPPDSPDEAGTPEELFDIEKRFGITLPADYREFSLRYGSGSFVGTFLERPRHRFTFPARTVLPTKTLNPRGT